MDLTRARSSLFNSSSSIRANEPTRGEDIKSGRRRMTSASQQRHSGRDLTPTETTMKLERQRQLRKAGANDEFKMSKRPQVQVFACRKFRRTKPSANGAASRPLLASLLNCSSSSRGGNFYDCKVLPALSLLALIVLLSAAAKTTEAIKLQPEGKEKFYWTGEQFVITCQNNNNIKNVKMRWIGPNGLDITEDRSQRVHAQSSGPHGHRLIVMNATASVDDGQYKCTLGSTDDRNPREHIEFDLKLYKTTSFRDTTSHLVLPAGQQGTLNCRVEFDPNVLSASVGWVRDQKPIEMFNDSTYVIGEYDSDRQLSQLVISPLTKQHDGVYTCRAVAVTSQLSKISDHDIHLETNYAPTFDKESHTVWVERSSLASRQSHQQQQQYLASNANIYGAQAAAGSRQNHQYQAARSRHNKHPNYPNGSLQSTMMQASRRQDDQSADLSSSLQQQGGTIANASDIIRVELRCTCQANPPASIMWHSTENSMFVLSKGEPAHVLEQLSTEIDGHNSSSTLVIGYNLGTDWAHRRDSYICSASNKLGKATKTYTIEQGDPPPAFNVAPHKQYDPQSLLFKFTLLGPNFDPESSASTAASSLGSSQQQQQEIVPAVDSFRIRAESPSSASSSSSSSSSDPKFQKQGSHWSTGNSAGRNNNKQNELTSVQWSLTYNQHQQIDSNLRNLLSSPQNFTVSLGKLPSGNQKLYLEAHNAVGWSPNSTYLGDYYIVSGATSFLQLAASGALNIQLAFNLLMSFYILFGLAKV